VAGLLALQGDGRLAWANAVAVRLMGPADPHVLGTERLGADLKALLALHRHRAPAPHRLPNGLCVWIEVRAPRRDEVMAPVTVERAPNWAQGQDSPLAADAGATLVASRDALIRRTLAAHGGNVAATARALGVSRGLVYRALR
jgi:DNA-binding NtrC family response regulator